MGEREHACAQADTDVREPPLGVGGQIPHPIRVGDLILPPYRGEWVMPPYYPVRVCGDYALPLMVKGCIVLCIFSFFIFREFVKTTIAIGRYNVILQMC